MQPSSHTARSLSKCRIAGVIQQKDASNKVVASRKVFTDQELIVGRDKSRCHYVLDDPFVSSKHLRIYTVVYENDVPSEVAPLVFVEDLSRNGTYWNGSLIGKGSGGYLLSHDDTLRLSSRTYFKFSNVMTDEAQAKFDLVQEGEMRAFRNDYIITDRLLGLGAFGRVYMAIEQFQKSQVACKMVDLRKLRPQPRVRIGRAEQPAHAEDVDSRVQLQKVKVWASQYKKDNRLDEKLKLYYREAEILASISHPNIIGLDKVFVTDNTIYMFQELVTAGDLFSYLERKNGKLLEEEAAATIRQILLALEFLHKQNIIHRDLKPDNVLMTTLAVGCRVVLTDFGAARRIVSARSRMSTIMGTAEYTAPEVLGQNKMLARKQGYTGAVDMWSVGCVTVVLLTGGTAFADPSTNEYSEKLANECDLTVLEKACEWQEASRRPKAFVNRLLILEEQMRMTATEALQDPWFTNEVSRTEYEKLYQRTIQHWRPRITKAPLIEFIESNEVKNLPCSREAAGSKRRSRRKSETPVEPPYKPFPRNMYQPLFPKRPTELYTMSMVRSTAIRQEWSPSKISCSSDRRRSLSLPPSPSDLRVSHARTSGGQADSQSGTRPVKRQSTQKESPRSSNLTTVQLTAPREDLKGLENDAALVLRNSTGNVKTPRNTPRGSPELGECIAASPLVVIDDVSVPPKETVPKLKRVLTTPFPRKSEKLGVVASFSKPCASPKKRTGISGSKSTFEDKVQQDGKQSESTRLPPSDGQTAAITTRHCANPSNSKEIDHNINEALQTPRDGSAQTQWTAVKRAHLPPRMRLPISSPLARSHTANSKKRRRPSIFDMEDEEEEDEEGSEESEHVPKRQDGPSGRGVQTPFPNRENESPAESLLQDYVHDEQIEEQATECAAASPSAGGGTDGRSRYFLPRI